MRSTTLGMAIDRHGVDVHEHLDREFQIPVLSAPQRQGDVMVVPLAAGRQASTGVGRDGFPVVRGENGGNTHLLLAEGDVRFDSLPVSPTNLALGTLTVGEEATAWLAHPEHGYLGIAPGSYELRRQREQADELRLVAD